jgi:hypothetical protein
VIIIFQPNNVDEVDKEQEEEKAEIGQAKPDLEDVKRKAWSFDGVTPPDKAEEIGREEKAGTVFIYYVDQSNRYWYATERGLKFAAEMEQIQKKKTKKKRKKKLAFAAPAGSE